MKKIVLILSVLFVSLLTFAQKSDVLKQVQELYQEGKYIETAELYEQILREGYESSGLYYNLGNTYFKMGENTKAIINYERALLLDPSDRMTRFNLRMAQNTVVDKINVLPELFLVRWYKAVETYFSADQWGYFSVVLFILFLVMIGLFIFSSVVWIKKTGFVAGIVLFLLTISTIFFAVRQDNRISNREYAIITTPSVTVKGSPDNSGTSLFLVHEGLKVKIISSLGSWFNIRLADGNEGWIAMTDLERI